MDSWVYLRMSWMVKGGKTVLNASIATCYMCFTDLQYWQCMPNGVWHFGTWRLPAFLRTKEGPGQRYDAFCVCGRKLTGPARWWFCPSCVGLQLT